MDETKLKPVNLPIDWYIPEDMETKFATNLVVQWTDKEFILSFFETFPPFLFGTMEEQQAKIKELKSAHAKCVVRIVVLPERMNEFVKILQDGLEMKSKMIKQE